MNKFHKALHQLVQKNEVEPTNFDQLLEKNIQAACDILNINSSLENIPQIQVFNNSSIRWKYISLSFYILNSVTDDESLLRINYINDVKKVFQFIVSLGILPYLIPGVGISLTKRVKNIDRIPPESISVEEQYDRLSSTVEGLLSCIKLPHLRNFVISNHLNDILATLFQLCYAPIKKPTNAVENKNEFSMTKEFYDRVINEKQNFQLELNKILSQTYTPQIIQELMFFYGNSLSPKWLKLNSYKVLINKLQLSDGVESLIKTILDFRAVDTGEKWKQYDIIVKLLMTKPINSDDKYFDNICSQVLNLIDKTKRNGDININLIRIVSSCIKYFYVQDKDGCKRYFLNKIFNKLLKYSTQNTNEIEFGDKTYEINEIIVLWYSCFVEMTPTLQPLPSNLLCSTVAILFHIYVAARDGLNSKTSTNLKDLLIKCIIDSEGNIKNVIFESFLFQKEINDIVQLNEKILITVSDKVINMENSQANIRISPLQRSEAFLDLLKDADIKTIIVPLCVYLLNIAVSTNSTTKILTTDFLHLEDHDLLHIDEQTERKLVCYKLLSDLIGNPEIHKYLQENSGSIVNFIECTLKSFIEKKLHKSLDYDSEQCQIMFTLIMILNIIYEKCCITDRIKEILMLIMKETSNNEMKILIENICCSTIQSTKSNVETKSEYKKALEDISDPLLPVRGHALMTLAKLIDENDPETIKNKQYILNISQQFLKDEDSYIYLNAIKVLAALGNSFPETILNILTQEYSTSSRELFEKDCETRMKLGEILLRVVKILGDNAPKYKSILLNTFLSGVRDEDHLMRASSLSNLGEVCRVLGYKLGSVVSEVLNCIHAVIATDKAVEARRAAVSVIRYLFVGLEKNTIVFLKDEILPIYRTLKVVYSSDPDDTTRLQAQLALEELNANVRDYIFPTVKLEKKIVMLN